MKEIYISRHSEPFRELLGNYQVDEEEQIRNEKNPLSVNGERKAMILSQHKDLQNMDQIYSSHYVRAMSTAKYIAENNRLPLNVDERLGERRFGVSSMSELSNSFFENQFRDWNYKLPNGECLNEVFLRMNECLDEILNSSDKRIMIVSHGTALSVMLKRYCDIVLNEEYHLIEIYFKNRLVFSGNWNAPELFKLEFDDNNDLINIKNIEVIYE